MQQVALYKGGERDYVNIKGDTGPLVYPAGFLYVYSVLHSLTDGGENIRRAQYIFLGFYLATIATVLAIYYRARVMPPWAAVFLLVSKRLHSIYMLRMFNDGVAMMLLFMAVYLFARQRWRWGCVLFSCAVSIKMNVLLFAPALFFLLLQSCGVLRTVWYLFICAAIQVSPMPCQPCCEVSALMDRCLLVLLCVCRSRWATRSCARTGRATCRRRSS